MTTANIQINVEIKNAKHLNSEMNVVLDKSQSKKSKRGRLLASTVIRQC